MNVLLVGAVPEALSAALTAAGATVSFAGAADVPEELSEEVQFLIVNVPPDAAASTALIEWLEVAEEGDVPIGLTTPRATAEFLYRVLLPHRAHPVVETDGADTRRFREAAAIVIQLLTPPVVSQDALKFGYATQMPADVEGYESRRSLSLVSPSMQQFLRSLADALHAMSRRAPELPEMPWDPADGGVPRRKQRTDRGWELGVLTGAPNLTDVLYAHDTDKARKRLRNTPAQLSEDLQSWGPPPNLLVLGESGTGKSLVANLVHRMLEGFAEPKLPMPFVTINCGAMTAENYDHALFGSAPGHWSGVDATVGELTRGAYGITFFDEIGDLRQDAQIRLLKFLDDQVIRPAGIPPFVAFTRVVAATNRNLAAMVTLKEFRHDLVARFAQQITLPPLRDRGPEEIRSLVDVVAQNPRTNPRDRAGDLRVPHIHPSALDRLQSHTYPDGNFRELEWTVGNAVRNAAHRRSRMIDLRDISLGSGDFVDDADVGVVDLMPGQDPDSRLVELRDERALRSFAARAGLPVLRSADALYVDTGARMYRASRKQGSN